MLTHFFDKDLLQLCQFEAARALLGAGAARIYLAGRELGEAETALRDAGVAEVICAGGDALGILGDGLAVALGEWQS